MTPLEQHRLVLKITRQKLIQLGPLGIYDWIESLEEDMRLQFHDALADPALSLRPKQEMPEGDWTVWLLRTGRGFGKNHASSISVNMLAEFEFPGKQGLIVGATFKDVRSTIFSGPSGLLATARPGFEPRFVEHNAEIVWPNGSKAAVRTADNPEDIRGLSVPWAYCDELIKWPKGLRSWQNITNCVREGEQPRIIATTTPLRGQEWIRTEIEAREDCIVVTGGTKENVALPKSFLVSQGNLTGKSFEEESNGEWVSASGNLWDRTLLDRCTPRNEISIQGWLDTMDQRLISVDPSNGKRDLAGMSLQGKQGETTWIMGDLTPLTTMKQGMWIEHLRQQATMYLKPGDMIVVETNGFQGIDQTIQKELPDYRVVPVFHAGKSEAKIPRAERAQMLYEHEKVKHFRPMPLLEKQMEEFYDVVTSSSESPDRVDALVNGINHFNDAPKPLAAIISINLGTSFGF